MQVMAQSSKSILIATLPLEVVVDRDGRRAGRVKAMATSAGDHLAGHQTAC